MELSNQQTDWGIPSTFDTNARINELNRSLDWVRFKIAVQTVMEVVILTTAWFVFYVIAHVSPYFLRIALRPKALAKANARRHHRPVRWKSIPEMTAKHCDIAPVEAIDFPRLFFHLLCFSLRGCRLSNLKAWIHCKSF